MCCLNRIRVSDKVRPRFRVSFRLTFSVRVMGSVSVTVMVWCSLRLSF